MSALRPALTEALPLLVTGQSRRAERGHACAAVLANVHGGHAMSALRPALTEALPLLASLPRCLSCRYRLPSDHTCQLGAADKPFLCPRVQPRIVIHKPKESHTEGPLVPASPPLAPAFQLL